MHTSDIVTRINQIADFFRIYPHAEAVEGIEQHIREFWDPRMQHALVDALAGGAAAMDPLALEAARRAVHLPDAA